MIADAVVVAALAVHWPLSAGAQENSSPMAALSAFQRGKARSLLESKLSCLGCHRIGSAGGIVGPDLSRGGGARTPQFVLAMMTRPREVAPAGTMPPVAMPENVARLIAAYVATLEGTPSAAGEMAAGGPAPATRISSDADRYARLCAMCHGAAGEGDGPNARYLPVPPARHASREAMSVRTDDRLYDAIAAGGAPLGRSPRMPAFGDALSDAEIRGLVRHIRELCQCEGPPWSRK